MFSNIISAQGLHPAYHNLDEIGAELTRLEEEYPDWIEVSIIGRSAQYGYPIWIAKLSDHPDRMESEPALLLIGQVHAEEVVGVEITLEVMRLLLENIDDDDYRARLEGVELYVIPTANPEGLEVVHTEDVTFRKNCRDNIGDRKFRFDPRSGYDTSGVDLNRNFGLHWDRGDTLFERGGHRPIYNYYRGSTPFSESETQALKDLALERRFFASISYHSSRSGNNSELVIAPWRWEWKRPPDARAIDGLCRALAERIPCQRNNYLNYLPVNSTQRNGQSPDWFYQATGTFQYMIEVGAEIQPDSTGMVRIVEDNLASVWYLMDLAVGEDVLNGYGTLTVLAEDAETAEPLEVTITVDAFDRPVLEPRRTAAQSGRFDWLMPAGEYNVVIERLGYRPLSIEDVGLSSGERTTVEARLEPLDRIYCRFEAIDAVSRRPVDGRVMLEDPNGGPLFSFFLDDGVRELELPSNRYRIIITSEGYLPFMGWVNIVENVELEYPLNPARVAYEEDFRRDDGWARGGINQAWGTVVQDGRNVLTESPNGVYPANADIWLEIETDVMIDDDDGTVVELIHRPYFEPGEDCGAMRLFTRKRDALSIEFSQFPDGWDTLYINLDNLDSGELCILFEVRSDYSVEEDGWLIDRVTVYKADHPYGVQEEAGIPELLTMTAYPNPVNGAATVRLSLPEQLTGELGVYDAVGRHITTLASGSFTAGSHNYWIKGTSFSSGVYYIRFQNNASSKTVRLMIVR